VRKAPFVLSGLALVLAITAGASGTVQRLITGRQIKNNSITSADIKNFTIVRKDLNKRLAATFRGPRGIRGPAGARGAVGATGAKGATGAAGAAGTNGLSAFNQVPAGVTIHGVVGLDVDTTMSGGDWGTLETMGMPGSAELGDGDVSVNIAHWEDTDCSGTPCGNTQPTLSDNDVSCTGTPAAPTAPSGKVCIYVLHSNNADDFFGYGVGSNQGFKLNFTNTPAPGDSFVDATWAYTG
jgi:collagen triple helix repeat protein